MWHNYIQAADVDKVLALLDEWRETARIVAGATDLLLEMERGAHKTVDTLIDISRIRGLDQITLDEEGVIHLGPLVTHNAVVGSPLLREQAFPLARACWEVGSPQIRNRGTVAGNLITASPANDTISPLIALGATLRLRSVHGERIVPLDRFYTGVRRTVLQPNEMVVDISFPALKKNQRGNFRKFALRRAQAISVLNAAVVLDMDGDTVSKAVITLGAVAPTIVHAGQAESYLVGKRLDDKTIREAADLAEQSARPINDLRGSAKYRKTMVRVLIQRCLKSIDGRDEREEIPDHPALLMGKPGSERPTIDHHFSHSHDDTIVTEINGKIVTFNTGQEKTLLHLMREEGALMGTKEGCGEGECGACTIFLDGYAVMSCLVPAPRAHGAKITTVEGISNEGKLSIVQQAFIDAGAVQCGYCTPGFVMSATKLLEEKPTPSGEEIRQALTGNLCRCTGYYKIIEAVELASRRT